MSSVEKDSNCLDDKKEAVVTTPLSEKKSMTKYFDKGTGELEYMKKAAIIIRSKYLDKYECQSEVYTVWFNLDSDIKLFFYN